ncbi:MAG: ATP-binding protein [Halioglobus sp.]
MVFRSFPVQVGLRVVLFALVLMALAYLMQVPGYPTLRVILVLVVLSQLLEMFRYISRTNAELTRFLDAVRYADFGQRFQMQSMGVGFEELGEVFTDIVRRFQEQRSEQEESFRHLKALMEHVPVPLLSLQTDGHVVLHNNASRRLFGNVRVEQVEDLQAFGEDFYAHMAAVSPGERRLALFQADGVEQRLTVSTTEIAVAGHVERLVSLQDIQSELDGVQLQAWQDLVRVLTHEIMNSITPVASLAKTAADLVDDAISKVAAYPEVVEELADVKSAVETVARRSDGLMQFVQSYRQLTRLPVPKKQTVLLTDLFANVEKLATGDWEDLDIKLSSSVEPPGLQLEADPDMLEQVLLNLLQNAEQALANRVIARVDLAASLNRQGRVFIEVSDTGPGIPEDVSEKVFVPFFTTKREGSGVGLALTRQVMLSHGGSARLTANPRGGATFVLTF